MPAADTAGDVELGSDEIVPLAVQRAEQRRLAGLEVHVGGAGGQVERADGVPLDGRRLADGHAVLVRGRAVVAARTEPAAPSVLEEERGQVEVAPLAGLAIELDQRHLDLRVPGRGHLPARAEERVQIVREALGDRQEPVVPGGSTERDGGLDEMAGAVELVSVGEVGPALARLRHGVERVDVAVGALRRGHQVDRRLGGRPEPLARRAPELPARGLEPLVHIRVHEHRAAVAGGRASGGDAEILEIAGRFEHAIAVRQRRVVVDRLAPGPHTVLDRHRLRVERRQRRRGALRSVDRSCRSSRRHDPQSLPRH